MHDLVFFGNSGNPGAFFAPSFPNLLTCSPKDARGPAKQKSCMLHSPSYDFDDGILLDVARSEGAIVFSFSDVLKERGFRRAILISKMRLLLSACRRAKCGFVFATCARNANEERSGREIDAFAAVLGVKSGERKPWKALLARLVEAGNEKAAKKMKAAGDGKAQGGETK